MEAVTRELARPDGEAEAPARRGRPCRGRGRRTPARRAGRERGLLTACAQRERGDADERQHQPTRRSPWSMPDPGISPPSRNHDQHDVHGAGSRRLRLAGRSEEVHKSGVRPHRSRPRPLPDMGGRARAAAARSGFPRCARRLRLGRGRHVHARRRDRGRLHAARGVVGIDWSVRRGGSPSASRVNTRALAGTACRRSSSESQRVPRRKRGGHKRVAPEARG